MTPEQVAKLAKLLRDMDAAQTKTDHYGGREIAWYYYREKIEEALSLDHGALDTYPAHERAEAIRRIAEASLTGVEYDAALKWADKTDPWGAK